MNLGRLRGFIAVAEAGSIRGAARKLGLTQPAVTKAIQQLERELGVPLVGRSVRGVTLTAYGNAFLARARLIAGELARASQELSQMANTFEGTVSVGLSPTMAELVAPSVIAAFQVRRPLVTVRIVGGLPTSTIHRVSDGTLDFVIGPRPVNGVPPLVDSWFLHFMKVGITVRAGHPLMRASSLAEFGQSNWLLTRSGANPDGPLTAALEKLGLPPPHCRLQSESLVAAQAIIADTDLVSLMPRRAVELGAMRTRLTTIDVPELNIANSVELFFRRETPLTPAALELANDFQSAASGRTRF